MRALRCNYEHRTDTKPELKHRPGGGRGMATCRMEEAGSGI